MDYQANHQIWIGANCYLDLFRETLVRGGLPIALSRTQFLLFHLLAQNLGQSVSLPDLIIYARGDEYFSKDNSTFSSTGSATNWRRILRNHSTCCLFEGWGMFYTLIKVRVVRGGGLRCGEGVLHRTIFLICYMTIEYSYVSWYF